jgi:hypothetical protein
MFTDDTESQDTATPGEAAAEGESNGEAQEGASESTEGEKEEGEEAA